MKQVILKDFDPPVEIAYFSSLNDLPFSPEFLTDFHVAIALHLATKEEDKELVKSYTEKHLKIIFDELAQGKTIAEVITRKGELVAAGYLVEVDHETMNLRQFHSIDPIIGLAAIKAHFQTFPNLMKLRYRLFSQRVEPMMKLAGGKILPTEIEPYSEDDKDILEGLSMRYFALTPESFRN